MQRIVLAVALAATLVIPDAAAAQLGREGPGRGAGLRVTPFVGFLIGFTRAEDWRFSEADTSVYVQSNVTMAGGAAGGMQIDVPLYGRFSLTAGGLFGSRADTHFSVPSTGEVYRLDGQQALVGRLGLAFSVSEPEDLVVRRLQATLFAGGVVLHERSRNRLATAIAQPGGTHYGANVGATVEMPLTDERVALQFGIEDNMIWWDPEPLSSLPYYYFGQPGTSPASTRAATGVTHALLVRAGIRMRL